MRKRLASRSVLWHTRSVKRLLLLSIALILIGVIVAVFLAVSARSRPQAALPNPNGYDDFAAAASWLVPWGGADLLALSPEGIRDVLEQNSKALEMVRGGLKKQSAVPVTNDLNWISTHLVQMTAHKSIARLLVAEGMVHLNEGRTNEAARSFADCIVFAHAAHRNGLMIDGLMAIACQAMGTRQLVQVAPNVSPDTLREILPDLIALDQATEPAAAIMQREREWSRGSYGVLRMSWIRFVTHRNLRAAEMSFEKKHTRSVASLRLGITELAVRLHEREHSQPPRALTELVSAKILPAVPLDPFSQQSFLYRATNNSWLLYSVGPDGKDDGGAPFKRGTREEKWDLLPGTP